MTRSDAAPALERLAGALNHRWIEGQMTVYLDFAETCAVAIFTATVKQLGLTSTWFPKLPELRRAYQTEVNRQQLADAHAHAHDDSIVLYRCDRCEDTKFIWRECPGGPQRTCGRQDKLAWTLVNDRAYAEGTCRVPHPYVIPCDGRHPHKTITI